MRTEFISMMARNHVFEVNIEYTYSTTYIMLTFNWINRLKQTSYGFIHKDPRNLPDHFAEHVKDLKQ